MLLSADISLKQSVNCVLNIFCSLCKFEIAVRLANIHLQKLLQKCCHFV